MTLLPPGHLSVLSHSKQANARAFNEWRLSPTSAQRNEALTVWNSYGQDRIFWGRFEREQLPKRFA